jgi:hypothetical protein
MKSQIRFSITVWFNPFEKCVSIKAFLPFLVPIIPEFLYTIRHQHMNQSQQLTAESAWTALPTFLTTTTMAPDYNEEGSGDASGDGDYHFSG